MDVWIVVRYDYILNVVDVRSSFSFYIYLISEFDVLKPFRINSSVEGRHPSDTQKPLPPVWKLPGCRK